MTDTRVSREALKAIIRQQTSVSSAAVSRIEAMVMVRSTGQVASAAVSREALMVMALRTTPAPLTVSRVGLKVMIKRNPFKYYDGTMLQEARLLGWWDGTRIRPTNRYFGPTT